MLVFFALEDRAVLDIAPTEEVYAQYSAKCGVSVDALKAVYRHLLQAEFHFQEERFEDASLNRARAKKNLEKARKIYKEGK